VPHVDADLLDLAERLGVRLEPPVELHLDEDSDRWLYPPRRPTGRCPMCEDPHDGPDGQPAQGNSCPMRWYPAHVLERRAGRC
jgi:hypothetical protein